MYAPCLSSLKKLETFPHSQQQTINYIWTFISNAPDEERRVAIDGILARCCFSQLSHVSVSVKAYMRIDFLAVLPREISVHILQYLDTATLCKASQVSRLWKELADDDIIWYRMCQQHINKKCWKCGWSIPLLQAPRHRQRHETPDSNTTCPRSQSPPHRGDDDSECSDGPSSGPPAKRRRVRHSTIQFDIAYPRPWKEIYKERFKVGLNWKYGRYKTTVLEGHTDSVMCLQIYGTFLVTGSYDATIKLWDLRSGTLVRTFLGHNSGIRAIQFDSNKIVRGSLDQTIKIWNWKTGQCVLTISSHNDTVTGLALDGKVLASSSMDKTIKIFNFEDKEAFTLRGHNDGVNSVGLDTTSRTLISASDDFTLHLWDLDTRQCIRIFEGHCGQVQQALFAPLEIKDEHLLESSASVRGSTPQKDTDSIRSSYGDGFSAGSDRSLPPLYVISCSLDNTLRLWNTSSGTCVRVDFGHTEGVWTVATDNLRIVSGAGDSLAKVWDISTGSCLASMTEQRGPVNCVGVTDSILATGGDDCRVVIYDFKHDEIG